MQFSRFNLALLAWLFVACGGNSNSSPPQTHPAKNPNLAPTGRLSDASIPVAARLRIEVDPKSEQFKGTIAIEIEVGQPLRTLWLHQKNLKISSASYETSGIQYSLAEQSSSGPKELLGLAVASTAPSMPAGRGILHIQFSGKLGELQGLFHQKSKGRWYAYTDFEATDARAAFPCYDDPRFKIPWDIELVVPNGQLAFANTRELSRSNWPGAKRQLFRFATTPKLPSYLVAFAAGPFDYIESQASDIPLRVIAPQGQAEAGRFVLDNTDQWLRYLEEYLGMQMPFDKLDFIAVPRFGGAMENPGLVTFTAGILLTGDNPSLEAKRRAAGVTMHELAHLWFGDSLTPHYWNDLWLNEAFATWLSDKAMANWQPEKAREVLRIADKSAAFPIDHGLEGRRVREPIDSPSDIDSAFDAITYRKGGALLTMLEAWIGEATMQESVRNYLREYTGSSVRAQDLLRSVEATTKNLQVRPYFESFLNQRGIPLVSAELNCGNEITLTVKQSRYLALGTALNAKHQQLWHLPLCVRYPSESGTQRSCTLLSEQESTLNLDTKTCPAWIHPNDHESGYYHYRLSPPAFKALEKHGNLDPREVQGYMHSVVANLRSGSISVDEAMPLLATLSDEQALDIQSELLPLLYEVFQSFKSPDKASEFAALMRTWYRPMLVKLGPLPSPNDSNNQTLLRVELLQFLATVGQDQVLKDQVRRELNGWLNNQIPVHPALLHAWLLVAAIDGDAALMEEYRQAQSSAIAKIYGLILSGAQLGFRDPILFTQALQRNIEEGLEGPMTIEVLQSTVSIDPALLDICSALLIANREKLLGSEDREANFERIAEVYSRSCSQSAIDALDGFAGEEFFALVSVHSAEILRCMAFANDSASKR